MLKSLWPKVPCTLGSATHSTFLHNVEGNLNAYLPHRITCGSQPMDKSVFHPSITDESGANPLTRKGRTGCLTAENRNQEPGMLEESRIGNRRA